MDTTSSTGGYAAPGIRTFLIADVRGYTYFTQEHGDEAAAKLAGKFAAVTREVVEGHGGSVLELRGDEALAVFNSARQAVSAALDLQERFLEETSADPTLPLLVGIGLDAGEAVPLERGYRGGALNLASRLSAKARPGECLASQAVVHLARKVEGARYVDRGNLHLKGLSESVRAFRVESDAGDLTERFKSFAPSRAAQRKRWRTRRTAAAAAACAAVAIAVAVALLLVKGGESAEASFQPGIVMLDAQTGEELAAISTSELREPNRVVFTGGHFWVENLDPLSLVEIEPRTGRILREIPMPVDEIATWTADGDTLWVTGPKLFKFSISLGHEIDRFSFDPDWHNGVAVVGGSLWLAIGGGVLRLDPATGRVEHRFTDLSEPGSLAYADGSLWTAGGEGVNRIDLDTNAVTETKLPLPEDFGRIAAGSGFAWTADPTKGLVYKVDRGGEVVATYPTGEGAGRGMSYSNGVLWVGNSDIGTVVGIDAITGARRTFHFGHPVQDSAVGGGVVLATLGPGRTYEDKIDELEGDVAKLFVPLHMLEGADPAQSGNFWVEYATCAGLVRYPDAPVPEGWRLEPELAAAMPEVSADGRVYTFKIRPGYRFSPPSNEAVTAETVRSSIERALSPNVVKERAPLLDDLEGVAAYHAGKADHISGVRAQGDTLTIRLTKRSPDFLARLALPFSCVVPRDTPLAPGGIGQTVGYPREAPQTVPAAGPYYIADRLNGEYTILKRNPNYTGPRPHELDAIALREGVDAAEAVRRVQDGSWDGIAGRLFGVSSEDLAPLLEVGSALDQRWGAESPAAKEGDQRYFASPMLGTGFVHFNARRGLFTDQTVREAAAHALDRRALARAWNEAPTDQLLPPGMPGFRDRHFYRLDQPDLARAKDLMDGRTGAATIGIFRNCDPCLEEARLVKSELARIGIRVRVEDFDDPSAVAANPEAGIDILEGGWSIYEADPANFLRALLEFPPIANWIPSEITAEARRISHLDGPVRVAAAAHLADRLVADDVVLATDGNGVVTALLSPRLGCRVFPPLGYGIDLAALCLNDE
jgi:class 3 adenylate cyclase/ABC-type transport system substrate-binding protein